MTNEQAHAHVAALSAKAANGGDSHEAMRYSQAACNIANASAVLADTDAALARNRAAAALAE